VPASSVDGEITAQTQPMPLAPPPFARQKLTEDLLTRRTPQAGRAVRESFRKIRSEGQFEPPSLEGTVIFPGLDGGGVWGGASFDPETRLLYVNSNEMPWILRLVERSKRPSPSSARGLYSVHCAGCHKADLGGSPPEIPSLVDVGKKYRDSEVVDIVSRGVGRMPGFARLGNEALQALARYLTTGEDVATTNAAATPSPIDLKYSFDGYNRFLDPEGYPAVTPPWGTLTAINLNKGNIAWQIPLGEYPELVAKGFAGTGSENYGGAVVTA